jgi:hypothetical protein
VRCWGIWGRTARARLLLGRIKLTAGRAEIFGLLASGFAPRLTSAVCWEFLAWSFLLGMRGSAIHVDRWLMNTLLLHHPAPAPALSPDRRIAGA